MELLSRLVYHLQNVEVIGLSQPLEKEFEYYTRNQAELVEKYAGKYIVIKGEEVLGAYDSITEAVEETSKTEEFGTFLVQLVEPGEESYTQIFHSRVAFM